MRSQELLEDRLLLLHELERPLLLDLELVLLYVEGLDLHVQLVEAFVELRFGHEDLLFAFSKLLVAAAEVGLQLVS